MDNHQHQCGMCQLVTESKVVTSYEVNLSGHEEQSSLTVTQISVECLPSCYSSDPGSYILCWLLEVDLDERAPGKKWLHSPQCPGSMHLADCRRDVLPAHLTPTLVSLMLFVLLERAKHGMTHGSKRDGGVPPGTGGFRWFTGLGQAIRECTCHHRSCVRKARGLHCKGKSNLGKCCSTHINLSICYYYYYDENLLKVLNCLPLYFFVKNHTISRLCNWVGCTNTDFAAVVIQGAQMLI